MDRSGPRIEVRFFYTNYFVKIMINDNTQLLDEKV